MKAKAIAAHTPTPWFYSGSTRTIRSVHNMRACQRPGERQDQWVIAKVPMRTANYPISHEEWEANQKFIITAVNAHDELVEAIQKAMDEISNNWSRCDDETGEECEGLKCAFADHRALCILEAALRRASCTEKAGKGEV